MQENCHEWFFSSSFFDFILETLQTTPNDDGYASFRMAVETKFEPIDDLYWNAAIQPVLENPMNCNEYKADLVWARLLKYIYDPEYLTLYK